MSFILRPLRDPRVEFPGGASPTLRLLAERGRGRVSLGAHDGMHTRGVAIAAIVEAILERPVAPGAGLTVDAVVSLGEIMKRFERPQPDLCTLEEKYAENGRA